ncbi:hypothetical protein GCM10027589_30300 [Actinocorallia lasiicapitis]
MIEQDLSTDAWRATTGALAPLGLTIAVRADLPVWHERMTGAEGDAVVINPAFALADEGEGFWLDVTDARGVTVACNACRILRTDDFIGLIASMRLWMTEPPSPGLPIDRGALPEAVRSIRGTVSHHGGLWVAPEHRRNGIVHALAVASRTVAIEGFGSAWDTAIVLGPAMRTGRLVQSYGFHGSHLLYQGFFPPRNAPEELHLVYSSRSQTLAKLRTETKTLLNDTTLP